jgi:hypothetical protein
VVIITKKVEEPVSKVSLEFVLGSPPLPPRATEGGVHGNHQIPEQSVTRSLEGPLV